MRLLSSNIYIIKILLKQVMEKELIDPVCGMSVARPKASNLIAKKDGKEYYFCNLKHKQEFLENPEKFSKGVPWYRSEKFGKVFPWVLGITLIGLSALSMIYNFMTLYMGIFFILFSLMKMPDWKGFIEAFSTYDILAKYIPGYAAIYPALEFILGILFITKFFIPVAAWITIVALGIGGIGVTIKLLKKEKFQCACLGTFINVPLTKVTLLEDIIMVAMAVVLLVV